MYWIRFIFNRTLNSVLFGIALMVLVAAYIAIGSGVASVREAFEMNEMQFFNAWPLKILMGLLVFSLATVTWKRIPFTPPRYGVWLVHAGIITLVVGTSLYYKMKVEGTVRLFEGRPLGYFYDSGERALFASVEGKLAESLPLPSLPRFKSYAAELDNASILERPDLQNLSPYFIGRDPQTGRPARHGLASELGLKDEVKVEVVGYYPYARMERQYFEDRLSNDVGIALSVANPAGGDPFESVLVSDDPEARRFRLGGIEVEHMHMNDAKDVALFTTAAGRFFQIDANVGEKKRTLFVEIGKSYALEGTGYTIKAEAFDPAFSMSGTGEPVPVLTLLVESGAPAPVQKFRRMVLSGKPLQTDFKLDVEGAGPMGKRQKEPLDTNLMLNFTFKDTLGMLPRDASERHILLTENDDKSVIEIVASLNRPSTTRVLETGAGELKIPLSAIEGPALEDANGSAEIVMKVDRREHVRRNDVVIEIPKAKRNRDEGASGLRQIVKVKVHCGEWSTNAFVPYSPYAYDMAWRGGSIQIPGANAPLKLQLGQTVRPMPANLSLQKFELIPYAGGAKALGSIMRDFRSTLVVEDRDTGEKTVGVAAMNQPIYFTQGPWWHSMSWLFFQAGWDVEGQQFTVIGVGNRPGVYMMTSGCAMFFAGLLYAFYLKPVIIRRMKRRAIEEADRKNKKRAFEPVMAE